jgi:hypothetical protein
MNFVAIDFSLNSPGICIYNDETNKFHFISYIKEKNGTKKEQKLQEEIGMLDDVTLVKQPDFSVSKEYSSKELLKIRRYDIMSNQIISLILNECTDGSGFIIAFEGSSYGSKMGTNNLIDMAAAAAILKMKMLSVLKPSDILTVAPTSIKKFAGKGNWNKRKVWDSFEQNMNNNESIETSDFFKFCKGLIEPESSKVPTPFDDLVDAFFLCDLIAKDYLETH